MAIEFIDVGTLRGLGTALVMIAFVGVTLWAYSSKRKSGFDEAANLPFADEALELVPIEQQSRSNKA